MAGLSDDLHLAFMGLALADALDAGATDSAACMAAVAKARKHAYAVINRGGKKTPQPAACHCPEDGRPDCACVETCVCDAERDERMNQ